MKSIFFLTLFFSLAAMSQVKKIDLTTEEILEVTSSPYKPIVKPGFEEAEGDFDSHPQYEKAMIGTHSFKSLDEALAEAEKFISKATNELAAHGYQIVLGKTYVRETEKEEDIIKVLSTARTINKKPNNKPIKPGHPRCAKPGKTKTRGKNRSKVVGTDIVTYYTVVVSFGAYREEEPKKPLAITNNVEAKYNDCLVESKDASGLEEKLDEIASQIADWMNEAKTGSCKMTVVGKASFTNITSSCAKKINTLVGSDLYPTDSQVEDPKTLEEMNDVLAAKRGENAATYLLSKLDSLTKGSEVTLEADAKSSVTGTPSGDKVKAGSAEALAAQKMDISVSCK